MTPQAIKSYAKINLSLGVIEKINPKYHKIESLISFLKIYDEISIKKIKNKSHKVEFFGKFSKGIGKHNTVTKLLDLLDKKTLGEIIKKFSKNKKCEVITLSTFNKESIIKIKAKLLNYVS